jgi:hypothetical protein
VETIGDAFMCAGGGALYRPPSREREGERERERERERALRWRPSATRSCVREVGAAPPALAREREVERGSGETHSL